MTEIGIKHNLKINEGNNCKDKTIIIVYGFSEYIDKYNKLCSLFCNNGYRVVRYDLRGHGRSNYTRGDIKSYYDMIDDLDEVISFVKSSYINDEIYVLGYSMGGLISMLYGVIYGAKEDVNGQILISPECDVPIKGFKVWMLNLISYIIPSYKIKNPMYEHTHPMKTNPPLDSMTLRFSREMFLKAPKYLKLNLDKYIIPALFIHGDRDKWVNIKSSRYAMDKILTRDKELVELKDRGHGLIKDDTVEELTGIIFPWIDNNQKGR